MNPNPVVLGALDRVLIHELLAEYGHTVDQRDWARFAELFVDDAVLDYTAVRAPQVCHGIGEILDYFRDANHPGAHHVTNAFLRPHSDGVHVFSKFLAPFTRSTHHPHRWFGGDYHDVVVAAPDGMWRFARKVCTPRWQFTAAPYDDSTIDEFRRTY